MKVSVIITVYNLEKFLKATIQSVLDQSYQNLEVVVINDCSTDRSAEIIRAYPALQYYKTAVNSGVLLATLEGLKQCTGDIICFLDGDDLWHKNKVEEVVKCFEENNKIIMVSHDYEYIDEQGQLLERADHTQEILKLHAKDKKKVSELMIRSVLGYGGNVWLGSAYSIRNDRKVISEFIQWAENLPQPRLTYQDHPLASFWITQNRNGMLAYVEKKLLQYRIHQNNYSGAYHNREGALKIALKAYNTALATLSIVENSDAEKTLKKRQRTKAMYYKFLLSLLEKKFGAAFLLNIKLTTQFYSIKDSVKEWARYFGLLLLGDRFFNVLSKK